MNEIIKIGEKLSPLLVEVEEMIWEFESHFQIKPEFSKEGFRASIKIFMS